jgi:hypothetical protein
MSHLDLFDVASFSSVSITVAPNAEVSRAFDDPEATNASLKSLSFTIGQFAATRSIMDKEAIKYLATTAAGPYDGEPLTPD